MTRSSLTFLAILVAGTLAVSACGKDPEVAKREFVQSGDAYVAEKKFAEAVIQYRNAVQRDPRYGEARLKLAQAYRQVGDMTNAYREAVRAADLLPDDVSAQVGAGQMLLLARQFEEARARAEKALAKDAKHVEAQVLKANALAGLSRLEEAVEEMDEAIRNAPDRIASYATLGAIQMVRGERQEAEAAFKKAVEIDPKSVDARLALANYYWSVGRAANAEEHLKAALGMDPKNLLANRALALFLVGSRRPAEAEPFLKTIGDVLPAGKLVLSDYYFRMNRDKDGRRLLEELASTDAPASVEAKLRLAGLGVGTGDVASATRLVDEVLEKNPRHVDALLARAQLLTMAGKHDESRVVVESAVRVAPQSAVAHMAMGRASLRKRDEAGAIKEFTEALRLNPRLVTPEYELARVHLSNNRTTEAEQFAQAAVKKLPGYLEAHLLLARLSLMKGDVAKAEPRIRALAKAVPQHSEVQGELGQLELLKKNFPAARQAFQRALTRNPGQLDALAGLVTLDLREKRPDAARARIEEAVKAAPQNSGLLLTATRAYAQMGDAKSTERLARQAIEADPNNIEAYSMLGGLYISQRRIDEAVAQFTTVAAKADRPVAALTILGMLKQAQGKNAEARKDYERALDVDPRAAVAANNLAWMHAESGGNLDIALELAKTAKAGLPDRADVNDTLGWIYYKKGLNSMAVPPLLESVGKDPKNPTYHFHLGLVYAALGDSAKARTSLEKSLALDSKFSRAAEIKEALASLKG